MNFEDTLIVLNEMLEKDDLIFSKREAIKTAIAAIKDFIYISE